MQLNSEIDWENVQSNFAMNKRTRIDNIFDQNTSSQIHSILSSEITFSNAFLYEDQVRTASDDELNALSSANKQDLQRSLFTDAANGKGFFYGTYRINSDAQVHPKLQEMFRWLNSDEILNRIQQICGKTNIVSANSQGTRYKAGDFLTRHNDINPREGREIAYVFNLTPEWHPDWGGLLQIFAQNGDAEEAYIPKFNSLSLFDVSLPHSVTYVTPFARQQRFAVTGWFCNK